MNNKRQSLSILVMILKGKSYETNSEGEVCVKKGKKLFFDEKGEVPRIELDPNGTFVLFVERPTPSANPIFRRLYVCFGGLKEGFKKHEVENMETWVWFLEHIQTDLEIADEDRFTILSDMQKGLLEEIQMILPNVEHIFCARHMYANWKKGHTGHDMQQVFWACCKATTET
ncbi:hypothetical protein V6N13_117052 [Hibiscus sabdariffa]